MVSDAAGGVGGPIVPSTSEPPPKLLVDFDGTLIRERFLIQWVRYLLKDPRMTHRRRIHFFLKVLFLGPAARWLSRYSRFSAASVRLAYRVFRNMDVRTIERMIDEMDLRIQGRGGLTLNPGALELLETMVRNGRFVEIWIVSQGAPEPAIHWFLKRPEMAAVLAAMGTSAKRIKVLANRLVVASDGRFSGLLNEPVHTKFSRIDLLRDGDVMIGDHGDERVFRRRRVQAGKFVNWKTVAF